ncbi:unnamed protein product [Bemisia tabaci]|uniref:Pre-mRNA-splicing factor SLU7 n=1 Tax=Bemisia tabaci TaxID=7038 RepID=A0A9P0AC27_BEMTA|nr:unnamed protein product [Bemisia tabaci]
MNSNSLPVSALLKSKDEILDEEPKKKSREDWRKAKELEEARKLGTAPAAVDEEGRDINPHIPQYISAAPWYYGTAGPTLKHQRIQPDQKKEFSHLDEWYKRGTNSESVAIKYRKGACENCGAITHKKKDCMERPRKIGVKYTNANIAPDEFVQPVLKQDFDGKRDRWAGYDPAQYHTIVEQYQKVEEAKRELRAQSLAEKEEEEAGEEHDEDKYVDEVDMPGTKVDSKQRITVRNLRIREDTAKYLRNLDPNSAYYDPKTRSMRENPLPGKEDPEESEFAGENFVRFSGDTRKHATAQLFAWDAHEKGVDVHLLAEPTKLEKLRTEYEAKKDEFKHQIQKSVLEKYGGEEHLNAPPKELLLAQTENYVEFSRAGTIIKGQKESIPKSRYEEDVYINNHTSVWGSYWHDFEWGYACCHSFIKNSYCVGEAGKSTPQVVPGESEAKPTTSSTTTPLSKSFFAKSSSPPPSEAEEPGKSEPAESSSEESSSSSSESSDSDSEEEKKRKRKKDKKRKKKKELKKKKREAKKLQKKLKKLEKRGGDEKLKAALKAEADSQRDADRMMKLDERKRPYNSMFEVKKPTDEEMEAYYIKRKRDEDPMAQFL